MKRKYLLRGIGIGLIIGVLVSYTAFKTGDYEKASAGSGTTEVSDAAKASEEATKKAEQDKNDGENHQYVVLCPCPLNYDRIALL